MFNTTRYGSLIKDLENVQLRANKLVLTVKYLRYKQRLLPFKIANSEIHTKAIKYVFNSFVHTFKSLLGLPLTSSFLLEYSSEYLNEYSLIPEVL